MTDYCKDCKHSTNRGLCEINYICQRPREEVSLVTGMNIKHFNTCTRERSNFNYDGDIVKGNCGTEGRYFEQKEPQKLDPTYGAHTTK